MSSRPGIDHWLDERAGARGRGALFALLVLLLATPAFAQFSQYTAPGSLALTPVDTRDALEEAMQEAPWNLGPVRLAPWFSLRDITYYDNVPGTVGEAQGNDLSASVGAGLHAYLPVGPRAIVAGYALPEYVWWKNRSERRLWNGRYGAAVFGYFSRLSVEARASRRREQQIASAELEQPVNVRTDSDLARLELRVFERLSLFAEGEERQVRYRDQDLNLGPGLRLSQLDRDETHVGGGVRYRPRERVMIGVGVDRVTSKFLDPTDDRSSSGTGPFAEVAIEGRKLGLQGRVAWVSLEPEGGSTFAPYDGSSGTLSLSWKPASTLTWQVYGGRSLAFSYRAGSSHYVDSRIGVGLTGRAGWRGTYRLFWESGTNSYRESGGDLAVQDDVTGYGLAFDIKMGRHASLVLGGDRVKYTSADPERDRDATRLLASVRFTSATAQWW